MDEDIGLHYKKVRIKNINIKQPWTLFLQRGDCAPHCIPLNEESTLLRCIFFIIITIIIIIYVTVHNQNNGKKHNSPLVGKEYTQHRLAQKYKTC